MDRLNFAFLCVLYLAISILSFSDGVSAEVQLGICLVLITVVGIPHGAIDHILFLKINTVRPVTFYGVYLLLMAGYLACWFAFPTASMVVFLVLSAYHFGESQLNAKLSLAPMLEKAQYFFWGTSILSGLIFYNHGELTLLFSQSSDLLQLLAAFPLSVHQVVLIVSTALTLLLFVRSYLAADQPREVVLKEIYSLAIIHVAFYILPLLPAFTLYFVVLHSAGVLLEEFSFLRSKVGHLTIVGFIRQLLPYTLLSVVGGALLVGLISYDLLQISYAFLAIILISILTLPHSVVMNSFYSRG